MIITYPLTMPNTPGMKVTVVGADFHNSSSQSLNRSSQTVRRPGDLLSLNVTLPLMTRASAAPWTAFFMKLQGSFGTFLAGDPVAAQPLGVGTGMPLVNGGAQTGNALVTDGWTASQTGIMKQGDWFQLGSGTSARLYMVVDDADSDGAGNAALTISPPLRGSPSNNAPLTINNPKGVFKLRSDVITWSQDEARIYGFQFQAVEYNGT